VSTERGGDDVEAGRRLGTPWRARRRAAKRGTEPGLGRGDAWKEGKQEVSGDDGRAAARGKALHRRQEGGQSRAGQHVPEEEEEREKVRRTCLEISGITGTSQ
jgi:hypothetical protein